MKSFTAVASCLMLSNAFATPHSYRELQERNDEEQSPSALRRFFDRFDRYLRPRQDVCYQDQYYTFVTNSSTGQELCEVLGVQYPDVTVVEDFTPIVTVTRVSTDVITENQLIRTTPVTSATVTVTLGQAAKRDAQVTAMPRDVSHLRKSDYINLFRRQADNSSELPPDNVIATKLNSACSCQGYVGSTVTQTYTNQPNFVNLFGFGRTTTTVYTTRIDREITSTVTVTEVLEDAPTSTGVISNLPAPAISTTITDAGTEGTMWVQTTGVPQGTPSDEEPVATEDADPTSADVPGTQVVSAPSGTDDATPSLPDPTAPPFTCPDDNGTTVSQMLGSERFDYDVYCDADLPDAPEIPVDLSYDTLAECAASCSLSNRQFGQPVCQGVSYYEASGTNCFLKSSANATEIVAATGVNVAILKRIAVGIDEENAEGTNTETISFSEPTLSPAEVGSYLGGIFGSSIPIQPPVAIITGRPALEGVTAYSTYVSAGETFSTGSSWATYASSNGSWWSAYAYEWSVMWTNAETIYAAGETAIPIITKNNGTVIEDGGDNGEYSVITTSNTTTITYQTNQTIYDTVMEVGNNTFEANGTLIDATTVTSFYSYTEAASGGDTGAIGGNDAGDVTSTSISQFSSQTVVFSSGFTGGSGGSQASGAMQTPPPVLISTSAFSTQSVIASSGAVFGNESGEGGGNAGSTGGLVTFTLTSVLSTEIASLQSGGVQGSDGGLAGGNGGSTLPAVEVTSTLISSISTEIVNSIPGGTGGSGVGFGSGNAGSTPAVGNGTLVVGGTTFSTGGVITSALSGTGISGATSLEGSGAITTPVPITSTTIILSTGGTGGFTSTGASGSGNDTVGSSSSRTFSFTNSPGPRNPGTESTTSTPAPATESVPSESGPAPYPSPSTVSNGAVTSLNNASAPVPTGTGPLSWTNSRTDRAGSYSSVASGTGPVPYPPLSTGPSSETPSSNVSLPVPTGTSPLSFTNSQTLRTGFQTTSSGTGPIPYPPLSTSPSTDTLPSNVTSISPTGTAPPTNGTLSGSSGSYSYSNSNRPRSGTSRPPVVQTLPVPSYRPFFFPAPSGTRSSIALSTGGPSSETSTLPPPLNGTSSTFPLIPTGTPSPSTCLNQTLAVTTIWATTTVYGCYDVCPPNKGGNYGGGGPFDGYRGPQSFGPPVALFAPTLSGDSTPPAETSAADEV